MGRPINKKYFGNTNDSVTSTTSDDHIGGEGITSISWSNLGDFRSDSSDFPIGGLALPAPTIPGGIQATWTLVYEVSSVVTGAGKSGLSVGGIFSIPDTNGGTATVASTSGANATWTVSNRGTGITSLPNGNDTQGITLTKISGPGSAASFNVDINFRIKSSSTVINEQGSGYTGAETFTVSLTPTHGIGTVPAGTIVLNNSQQNAILGVDLATSKVVDIVKQESSNSYWVQGTDPFPYLLDLADPSQSVGLYIKATDSSNKDYWVKKLAAHRVTLGVVTGGGEFNEDDTTTWTFDAPVAGVSVTIRNA